MANDLGAAAISRHNIGESCLDQALLYAKRGWGVFPVYQAASIGVCSCPKGTACSSVGKHPRIQRGFKAATTDEAVVRDWWERWPNANIGIATGKGSLLVVIDVDPRNGGDESLCQLQETYGELSSRLIVETGGSGQHIYFSYPDQSVDLRSRDLTAGVQVKADGGYVVAPPSLHTSGEHYRWASADISAVFPSPMPDWLIALVAENSTKSGSSTSIIKNIEYGARNTTLVEIAGVMRRKGLTPDELLPTLNAVNEGRCNPPLPQEEVVRVANSIGRYPSADSAFAEANVVSNVMQVGQERAWNSHSSPQPLERFTIKQLHEKHTKIPSLPFLDAPDLPIFFKGLSHIVAAYPKVGKTELLFFQCSAWARSGMRIDYISEESRTIWGERVHRLESLPPEETFGVLPALGDAVGSILETVKQSPAELVVVDSTKLLRIEDTNSEGEVASALLPIIAAARANSATLIIAAHHSKIRGSYGRGLTGNHVFLALVDSALEIDRVPHNRFERSVNGLSRLFEIPDFIYEKRGKSFVVTDRRSNGVTMLSVKDRVMRVLQPKESEAKTQAGLKSLIGDPEPGDSTLNKALDDLYKERRISRDPVSPAKGKTYRYWS